MKAKAKEDFRKWYNEQTPYTPWNTPYDVFMGKHPSMKWGVLVDFYDSVGIPIEIIICLDGFHYNIDECFKPFKTRPEARKQALIKAEQIYNEL